MWQSGLRSTRLCGSPEEGNPNDLGYPWLDPSTGELVVSAATAHGRALLQSTSFGIPIRIRDVHHSTAELRKIQDDATFLYSQGVAEAALIYQTGPDFRDNRAWITIARFSRPLLDELARRFPPDAVVVVVDPTRYPPGAAARCEDLLLAGRPHPQEELTSRGGIGMR